MPYSPRNVTPPASPRNKSALKWAACWQTCARAGARGCPEISRVRRRRRRLQAAGMCRVNTGSASSRNLLLAARDSRRGAEVTRVRGGGGPATCDLRSTTLTGDQCASNAVAFFTHASLFWLPKKLLVVDELPPPPPPSRNYHSCGKPVLRVIGIFIVATPPRCCSRLLRVG